MSFISDSSAIDYLQKLKLNQNERKLEERFEHLLQGELSEY